MDYYTHKVAEFFKMFELPVAQKISIDDREKNFLCQRLLNEEMKELELALENNDTIGVLDALVDLQYILSYTVLSLGFQRIFLDAFDEVHRSNLTKLGDDNKPIKRADGKILKGPHYQPPQLKELLE